MNSNYYSKQIVSAKKNYNYFFVKMIFSSLKVFTKLALILLINTFLNYTITNIIAMLYTLYSLYLLFKYNNYYINIIRDIKKTLGINDLCFEIDFSLIRYDIIKGVLEYGR